MEPLKESVFSGSPRNTNSDTPVTTQFPPQVMNLNFGNLGGGPQPPPPPPQPQPQPPREQPQAPPGTATMSPVTTGTGGASGQGSLELFGKKKRGRPRKYDSEGNLRVPNQPPPGFSLTPGSSSGSKFSSKRGRGSSAKSHASGSWNLLSSLGLLGSTTGTDFTPHVVTVHAGEDVAGKIFSIAQKGPMGICILSANGAISKATLRQPGSSGGLLTYEGRFELLSLSGSFTVPDSSAAIPSSGLSVSLAGPDGRVIGGGVAGLLTAATPIQIVVGSFMPNGQKPQKRKYTRQPVASHAASGPMATVSAAGPISQSNPGGENPLGSLSQLPDQGQRESVSASSDKLNLDDTLNGDNWNDTEDFSDHRPSPDINISLPDE
ncbi:AT-hook motif nuclear-localized protein 1-like isoform X1 [Arachis stenosperma]|uniref:AT-hook motif nuclear-localized protein 1-like isoform X1 n=1 Tax=Arachis stenosperma TaxID=217475 RepID=UPI0025ACE331|nr:AT-hook motif nuclear-localized protein 1-like isoform X1 [Arachis stenosperma]